MNRIHISLDDHEVKPWLKITQIIFGMICLGISGIWMYYMIEGEAEALTFWIATLFLLLFGLFQIYSGAGLSRRYIVFGDEQLVLKKSTIGKPLHLHANHIRAIEIGPAEIVFLLLGGSDITLKLGLRYFETGEMIKERTELFARENQILLK